MLLIPPEMKQHSMNRMQSRNSQLLTISGWLRNAGTHECYTFLDTLKNELHHESIGSLLSSLLVNNPSLLTNQSLDKLCMLCQDYTEKKKDDQKEKEKVRNKTKNSLQVKNTTKTKTKTTAIARQQRQCHLLSLSIDSFSDLARYLLRYDGISLGLCCHRLYQATQTISFLSNVGYGEAWLTCNDIQRIYDYKADPWMFFVNCKHLTLASVDIEDTKETVTKLLQSSYYTNWMEKMIFYQLESLIIGHDGDKLLSCLPVNWIDMIFGLQRLNKHLNRLEMKNTYPLRLVFENLFDGRNNPPKAEEFFNTYHDYLVKKCDNTLANIRPIWMLECDSVDTYNLISKSIGKYLQPNYDCFRCREGIVIIHSLQQFCDLFHKNLFELELEMLRFDNYDIMHEIYQTIVENGYIFSLLDFINRGDYQDLDVLTDEQVEYICNDEQLMTEMARFDAIFAVGGLDCKSLFRHMWHSKYAYDFCSNRSNNNRTGNKYDCLYRAYYVSILAWINARLDWICDGIKYKLSQHSKSNLTNVIASKHLILLTSAVNKELRVKTLHLTQKQPTWTRYSRRFLKSFNRMTRNSVLFRLLKFGKTVENLTLEFIPQISLVDVGSDQDHSNVWQFGHAILHIFDHFKNIRNVSICMNFGTNFRDYQLKIGDETVDTIYSFTIDEMISAVTDYITTYATTIMVAIAINHRKLKQKGFSMRFDALIGDSKVHDINTCVKVEDYLVNKGLMTIDETEAIQTGFDISDMHDIEHYGRGVIKVADSINALIRSAGMNLRNNRYRSSTYRFWIPSDRNVK